MKINLTKGIIEEWKKNKELTKKKIATIVFVVLLFLIAVMILISLL